MNKKSNIIVGAVVIGVIGVSVFAMSVMSKGGKGNEVAARVEPAKTELRVETKVVEAATGTQSGSFVASKQGKKYFPSDCGSAKTIKEENKVYFGSESEALEAGYERTLACK